MDTLEQIKQAEEQAVEQKRLAKEQADKLFLDAQKTAADESAQIIAKAKYDASEKINTANADAEKKAEEIHKKGDAENVKISEAARLNKKKAVKLLISYL